MDLTGKYLVIWLSAEAIETFLGVLEPRDETAMMSWIVGGEVVGESGPGLWVRVRRVLLPDGRDMPLQEEPIYFLRWELVTTAPVRDATPGHPASRVTKRERTRLVAATPFSKYPGGGRRLLGPVTGANCRRGYGLKFFQLTGIGSCAYCGANLAGSYGAWLTIALDHVVPENVGQALGIPDVWVDDFSNCVLACGACNMFDNTYEPSFQPGRPTNLKGFFTFRDRVFRDRKARVLKCHEQERAFFTTHWQRVSTTGKRRE